MGFRKKKNEKEPTQSFLSKRIQATKAFHKHVNDRYEREKDYFASDEERENNQAERDQEFFHKLVKMSIIVVILVVLYNLLIS